MKKTAFSQYHSTTVPFEFEFEETTSMDRFEKMHVIVN